MKRIKISFLAVIAVLAMSFTIAENTNFSSLEGKKALDPADCFLPSDLWKGKLTCPTSSTDRVDIVATTCLLAQTNYATIHLFNVPSIADQGSLFIESTNQTTQCPLTSGAFCCFNVEVDPNPLDTECVGTANDQPQVNIGGSTNYYRISTIRCKTPQ